MRAKFFIVSICCTWLAAGPALCFGHDLLGNPIPATCSAEPAQVIPDVVQAFGVQVDDLQIRVGELSGRRTDVFEGNRADLAQILGDDDVRPRALQAFDIDVVDRQGIGEDATHIAIDDHARGAGHDPRRGQDRQALNLFWPITFVGDTHERIAQAQGAHQLRGGWEKADDSGE